MIRSDEAHFLPLRVADYTWPQDFVVSLIPAISFPSDLFLLKLMKNGQRCSHLKTRFHFHNSNRSVSCINRTEKNK